MNAALVGLHVKRLAAARALALEAIYALSESVEAIRKAEIDADFKFALPWPELTQLTKTREGVGRIDYLTSLALRSEVIAKHEACCASVRKQLSQEVESRRLAIGELDSAIRSLNQHAQARAAKADEAHKKVVAAEDCYVRATTLPTGGIETHGWEYVVACVAVFFVVNGVMPLFVNPNRVAVGEWALIAALFLGLPLPYTLKWLLIWHGKSGRQQKARDNIAAAEAACLKTKEDAQAELASALPSLGASLETAQKRFASAQSAVSGLGGRLPIACPIPESKAPPLLIASSGSHSGCVVSLTSAGSNIVAVIKSMRELVPGLGLAEAKALAENTPSIIGKELTILEAECIRRRLETVGAKVVIIDSCIIQ